MGLVQSNHPAKVALVGAGGSGKSTLACALGHAANEHFRGNLHWFRIGAWDVRTLAAMMALRFRVRSHGRDPLREVRRFLVASGPHLVVLDNHEDDRSTAALLDGLRDTDASWVITARRSLLSGVTVFPVVPPLVTAGQSPFPRVASITRLLRWNPVALDLADALVESSVVKVGELGEWLSARGIERVRPVDHEDDLPEVGLLVERAWKELSAGARRMLGVLAHMGGDHMDVESLGVLAGAGRGAKAKAAVAELVKLRLVQEPFEARLALHATVRHALWKRTSGEAGGLIDRLHAHYVEMLERDPSRGEVEQTHLFAAMDHAQEKGDLGMILRVQKVAERVEP
ncbi:MAG: hypothetical protein R3B70_03510 [Polyangiaceae bacterium]